ncbi:hypothetical protein EZJ19_08310 [Parasulfuritortus cantonensis]|uniref:DUF302 domain-containing protein n=1 Tax=Parasulfuritortus cantonensis TaxID=2528202 RepID=A0A4V2NVW8_9PROT|nr:hypothetical protein [Parasulfuritortus cantonensis]TCJ15052.1 hypothetical protein EZJ19_08310 [Parasulfuritortus cantonensis]
MHKWLGALLLMAGSTMAWAVSPYINADKVAAGDIYTVMGQVEGKLVKGGFNVIGKYAPAGLPGYGVVVATDNAMLATIKSLGGPSIVGAAIRVGVKADGSISYMNPDYWYRAYFRTGFKTAERTVKGLQARLAKALGSHGTFGGDVAKSDLPDYQYMFGMESFESDKNLLIEHLTFDDAIKAIEENLARGTAKTSKVYEVIMPEKKIAVFGVAMTDPKEGDASWVKVIGADNIAALPYEIYVVGPKVDHLFARYRIALGWPGVGMGQFMRIVEAPYIIQDTMAQAAGGAPAGK